ncbi:alpha-1,2-mannosyltransferase ALG9 [Aplysia californica]|uniref:Mannosyltransferase n=1 Tax=Aplysia californica TaxID=6500 RepID=A0ABM0JDX3_APLCA|nr:alpha-1,2-mannosyltransferase ALG9 [Aplysia californica]
MGNKRNLHPPSQASARRMPASDRMPASGSTRTDVWTPTVGTAFKLLMSARLCAALWSVVSDCDETYNYWEPAHYLHTGKGFQTWEYSPAYAIRSYAYILLHVLPMKLLALLLGNNTILVFYMTRCLLGLACALSEVLFYRGVCSVFGPNVGRLTLVFLLFAAGMFGASAAFLPSSFSMYLTMVAYGAWLLGYDHFAVLAIAASGIIGWPFAAALGVPIAFDIVFLKQKYAFFIKWCIVSLLVFLVPMVAVDHQYYGKLLIAPLNIVLYNVFSGHGPDLYGTEPLSFYLINGFLNFNFVYLLALGSLPFLLLTSLVVARASSKHKFTWLSLAPMYIWILIMFTRPHKEERFLFPIYPFFAMAAAMVLDNVQRVLHVLTRGGSEDKGHYAHKNQWMPAVFSVVFAVMSLSRIVAVHQGYHAPLDIYVELHRVVSDPSVHTLPVDKPVNVCVGKEWYRFPSSFFLPGPNWNLQFVQSEFRGLLPKPYEPGPDGTKITPTHMNDMNREEPSRYIDVSRCHYLVDRDTENWTALEPQYSNSPDWTIIKQVPFLDASRSDRIFRAFYVPFLSVKHCRFARYSLLKATGPKKSSKQKRKS